MAAAVLAVKQGHQLCADIEYSRENQSETMDGMDGWHEKGDFVLSAQYDDDDDDDVVWR